jgi:hypothetical protein
MEARLDSIHYEQGATAFISTLGLASDLKVAAGRLDLVGGIVAPEPALRPAPPS